jgi:DNA-directed RNA polymerase specialized sigma24 family protein
LFWRLLANTYLNLTRKRRRRRRRKEEEAEEEKGGEIAQYQDPKGHKKAGPNGKLH